MKSNGFIRIFLLITGNAQALLLALLALEQPRPTFWVGSCLPLPSPMEREGSFTYGVAMMKKAPGSPKPATAPSGGSCPAA
jgi:hypothetical protein